MGENLHGHRSLDVSGQEFKNLGYLTVDKIADFLDELPTKKVTGGKNPSEIKQILGGGNLPLEGKPISEIIDEVTKVLFEHSLFNGHPRFWGYITSSAAPIGALADLIASSINPNVGAFTLSPVATEIEKQTIRWISEFIGYGNNSTGILVSGGNMANVLGFLTARKQVTNKYLRHQKPSLAPERRTNLPWGVYLPNNIIKKKKRQLLVYCAQGTHTWINKAVEICGDSHEVIRWIVCNEHHQMDTDKLASQIKKDVQDGQIPFLVVGTAGSVGTGGIDDLDKISSICKSENLWFHIDGAYGVPAAVLPELHDDFTGLEKADSLAIDPHKWFYSPIEAGCLIVRKAHHLKETFGFDPDYYNFKMESENEIANFHEYGIQNSRGFRALKIWMAFKQIGKKGYMELIRRDINLAKYLYHLVAQHPHLEPQSQCLSITTFRYKPEIPSIQDKDDFLNKINEKLLNRLQAGGEVFLSNAIIDEKYYLRVCVVNFRTKSSDMEALIKIVIREGESILGQLRE